VLAENGTKALYLNFRYQVASIAFNSAVLNVTRPLD